MLRAPSEVWSTIVCSVGCYGDRGHDGDIAGGVELSAKVGLRPRGRKRPGEKGETTRGLTAVAVGVEAGSGTRWRRRIDGDGGRSPRRGTATWRRCRASEELWSGGEEEGVVAELLS